ncbi:hypothetical protein PRIPAC_84778 [Pristionchus pacificus]|uniref:Uncharacterized protein n=1 Tax=Pristionchus pacificus TaxID=54126 RepID=A0A2A6CCT5_PRIPA|nr:hypothetical protein PRIPAC_84778 [Pristionchus pacificus]|eukprot:PDM75853.1 hypothetical protein PRIPAC_40232 [Pristionchus pacificus]
MQSLLDTLLLLAVTVCTLAVSMIVGCGSKKPKVMTDMPNTGGADSKMGGTGGSTNSGAPPPAPPPTAVSQDSKDKKDAAPKSLKPASPSTNPADHRSTLSLSVPDSQLAMRMVGLLLLLVTVAVATWLGDEYWTLIGPRGEPIQGEAANFARVAHFFKPQEENRFVAYWMTNTHYAGRMYEQFGEAFRKEEEEGEAKYCARFYGSSGEAVETCENFRILTVPDRYRDQTMQVLRSFAWTKIDSVDEPGDDKIGYNDHLVCAFGYEPKKNEDGVAEYKDFTFGDAVPSQNTANSVNPFLRTGTVNVNDYENYLLRLLVGESTAQQNIPRLPSPPSHQQHHAHRQHVERRPNVNHLHEEQNQQDVEYARRLAEYNEKVRQQQLQQQPQVHVQATHQQTTDNRFICDTYGRVFEMRREDGRTRYHTYDLAAHGGVRPPCTLIGETAGQTGQQAEGRVEQPVQQQQQQVQQRQEETRPYSVRRSCTGSRQKKDADGDC